MQGTEARSKFRESAVTSDVVNKNNDKIFNTDRIINKLYKTVLWCVKDVKESIPSHHSWILIVQSCQIKEPSGNCNIYYFLIPRYFLRLFSPFPLVLPLGLTVPAFALLLPYEPILDFRNLLPLPFSELPQPLTARPGEVPRALPHVFPGVLRLRITAP